jgi:hypothetical protein
VRLDCDLSSSEDYKMAFSGAVEKYAFKRLLEKIFKALFKISMDFSTCILGENRTMSSAYRRTFKSRETRDWQMGNMYKLKRRGLRQFPRGRPLYVRL